MLHFVNSIAPSSREEGDARAAAGEHRSWREGTTATCTCGRVVVEAVGTPIITAECFCDDCRRGWTALEKPGTASAFDPSGGVVYLLYRKDRVTCTRGSELLEGHKLNDETVTYRVIARCCGAPMGTAYDRGPHWVDIVRSRVQGSAPPIEVRTFTRNRPAAAPDGIPGSSGLNFRLMVRLFAAWIPMLLSPSRPSAAPRFFPAPRK